MGDPTKPEGIKLVLRSGQRVRADVKYVGDDQDGVHVWEVIAQPQSEDVMGVHVRRFPGRTALRFPLGMGVAG